MAKSYYAILGIAPSATADEIKSAYRRLSKEFHPDHYSGNRQIFLEIQEAYSVLADPRKRRRYEEQIAKIPRRRPPGRPSARPPEPLIPEKRPVDLGKISPIRSFQRFAPSFDEIFDWLWSNFGDLQQPKSGRVRDLTIEVPLTARQALRGGTARIMVPARAVCPTCGGRGGVGPYECFRCGGEGAITGEMPVSISFPSGLTGEHAVTLSLDRFGIKNLHLTVIFRPSQADEI